MYALRKDRSLCFCPCRGFPHRPSGLLWYTAFEPIMLIACVYSVLFFRLETLSYLLVFIVNCFLGLISHLKGNTISLASFWSSTVSSASYRTSKETLSLLLILTCQLFLRPQVAPHRKHSIIKLSNIDVHVYRSFYKVHLLFFRFQLNLGLMDKLLKIPNVKFHENPPSEFRIVPPCRTDRRRYSTQSMTRLTVVFPIFSAIGPEPLEKPQSG